MRRSGDKTSRHDHADAGLHGRKQIRPVGVRAIHAFGGLARTTAKHSIRLPYIALRRLLGEVLSLFGALAAFALFVLLAFSYQREQIYDLARYQASQLVERIVPNFDADFANLRIAPDELNRGWVRIDNVVLHENPGVGQIEIGQLRFSFDPIGLITGRFGISGLSMTDVNLRLRSMGRRPEEIIASLFSATRQLGTVSPLRPGAVARLQNASLTLVLPDGGERPVFSGARSVYSYDPAAPDERAGDYKFTLNARQPDGENLTYFLTTVANGPEIVTRVELRKANFGQSMISTKLAFYYDKTLLDEAISLERFADGLRDVVGSVEVLMPKGSLGGTIGLDQSSKHLKLDGFKVEFGEWRAEGQLNASIEPDPILDFTANSLTMPTQTGSLTTTSAGFSGRLDLNPRALDIQQLWMQLPPNDFAYGGTAQAKLEGRAQIAIEPTFQVNAGFTLARIDAETILSAWPRKFADGAYTWASANVQAATFKDARIQLNYEEYSDDKTLKYSVDADIADARLRVLPILPALQNISGKLALNQDSFSMNFAHAELPAAQLDPITLGAGTFAIDFSSNDAGGPMIGVLDGQIAGENAAIIAALMDGPVDLSAKLGVSETGIAEVGGRSEAQFTSEIPLSKGIKLTDVIIDLNGKIRDLDGLNPMGLGEFSANEIDLALDQTGVSMTGNAMLAGNSLALEFHQPFDRSQATNLVAKGLLTRKKIAEHGFALPAFLLGDDFPVELDMRGLGSRADVSGRIDLKALAFDQPSLGLHKAIGEPGHADFTLALENKTPLSAGANVDLGGIAFPLTVEFAAGRLAAVHSDAASVGRVYQGGFSYRPANAGNSAELDLANGRADLRVMDLASKSGTLPELTLAFDNMVLQVNDRLALTSLAGAITLGQQLDGAAEFRVNEGGTPINARFDHGRDGKAIVQLSAEDAGNVLRDAGYFSGLRGGQFAATLAAIEPKGAYIGKVTILNPVLQGPSSAVTLLQAVSILGLVDAVRGQGLNFDAAGADFKMLGEQISVSSGYAVGPALGVSFGGTYDMTGKQADLTGVLSPAYLVNGALRTIPEMRDAMGAEGEGLFGINWQLSGQVPNLRPSVNPLSLLTPGRMRELFSGAP